MAVLLRLCDEDQVRFPGGDDGWVRFDEDALSDVDSTELSDYEAGMQASFNELFTVDKPRNTILWRTIEVWLARRMAGLETPPLAEFRIKTLKVQRKPEPDGKPVEGGDADPPVSSGPSTAAGRSRKRSR